MKKLMLTFLSLMMILHYSYAEPTPGLLAKFKGRFKAFSEVQWIQNENKFIAYYKETHDVSVRVFFDRNENVECVIRYYQGSKLPAKILKSIKANFPRNEITSVSEISNEYGLNYHLSLATPKIISKVRFSEDGEDFEILDAFINATAGKKQ